MSTFDIRLHFKMQTYEEVKKCKANCDKGYGRVWEDYDAFYDTDVDYYSRDIVSKTIFLCDQKVREGMNNPHDGLFYYRSQFGNTRLLYYVNCLDSVYSTT